MALRVGVPPEMAPTVKQHSANGLVTQLLRAGALRLHAAQPLSRGKFASSEFTSSAWVQVMQCGPSFTTTRRALLISLAMRSPEAVIGRIRSASPCMTRVGTSMQVRSLRKSSCHVGTQARQAVAEAPHATFQLD